MSPPEAAAPAADGQRAPEPRAPQDPPPECEPACRRVEQDRCQPDREPCTCGYLHQPFADCEPAEVCPSARAFTVACDPRCCP